MPPPSSCERAPNPWKWKCVCERDTERNRDVKKKVPFKENCVCVGNACARFRATVCARECVIHPCPMPVQREPPIETGANKHRRWSYSEKPPEENVDGMDSLESFQLQITEQKYCYDHFICPIVILHGLTSRLMIDSVHATLIVDAAHPSSFAAASLIGRILQTAIPLAGTSV